MLNPHRLKKGISMPGPRNQRVLHKDVYAVAFGRQAIPHYADLEL